MAQETSKRRMSGVVVSNKGGKTAVVRVNYRRPDELYGKYVRRSTKLHVHDPENTCQEGDFVTVEECRRVSKNKAWRLVEVVERAVQV
ncbi:30S ribosomal protein S17 [Thiohalorhabdus methylotrophus]|uniref:Small ribosomal subunit protein uS17 n=1 Tax=Thiohalorhabdus methylotrophus TaxID=3242694 RepID=A0ABV4TR86_9GAMM